MKIGVMGGTFNPPHKGHLAAADAVRQALGLHRVLFIPANLPPHKRLPEHSATIRQRCEMVRLMIKPYLWAEYSGMEVERGGTSYTVDTLKALYNAGENDLTLIVGTDMLLSFDHAWREPQEIVHMAGLAVVARGTEDRPVLEKKVQQLQQTLGARIVLVTCPVLPISSTDIRQHGGFEELTTPEVAAYIRQNRLYQNGNIV